MRSAIVVLVVAGIAGQAAVYAAIGGPGGTLDSISQEGRSLEFPFAYFVLAGFPVVALLIWYAWHRPRTRLAKVGFAVLLIEVMAFFATIGSRTNMLAPIALLLVVRHHLYRQWSFRQMAALLAVVVVAASAFLVVRQAAHDESLGEALEGAPAELARPAAVLDDNTGFDDFFMAINHYGEVRPHRHGGSLVDAFRSYVPAAIDPGKPESTDIEFREEVLGPDYHGGRPYSLVGELYADFGYPGIAVGGLVVGIVALAMVGLVTRPAGERPTRLSVVLFAVAMLVLYKLTLGVYSIALGDLVELGAPLIVAIAVSSGPGVARRLQFRRRAAARADARLG